MTNNVFDTKCAKVADLDQSTAAAKAEVNAAKADIVQKFPRRDQEGFLIRTHASWVELAQPPAEDADMERRVASC